MKPSYPPQDPQQGPTWHNNETAFYNDHFARIEHTLAKDKDPEGALQSLRFLGFGPGVLPVHYDIRRQVIVACCQMAWGRYPQAKDILSGCQRQWEEWIRDHPQALDSLEDGDDQTISGMRTRIERLLAKAERLCANAMDPVAVPPHPAAKLSKQDSGVHSGR